MNVSEADLNKKQKDVLGKQVNIPFVTEKVRIGLIAHFAVQIFKNISSQIFQLSIEALDEATDEIENSFIATLGANRPEQNPSYDIDSNFTAIEQTGSGNLTLFL